MSIYQEGKDSTATSEGKTYQLDILFQWAHTRKRTVKKVSELDWILEYTEVDEDRVKNADLSKPLLIYWSDKLDKWITLDGAHRLTKAKRQGRDTIACVILVDGILEKAEIKVAKESIPSPLFNKW